MKVVIVEDDSALRDAISKLFDQSGHVVQIFQSANDLLFNGFELPDLFILDWRLRGLNGMELCRRLKADPITNNIPVYIMTGASHAEEEAKAAGADGLIHKPFRKTELFNILKRTQQT